MVVQGLRKERAGRGRTRSMAEQEVEGELLMGKYAEVKMVNGGHVVLKGVGNHNEFKVKEVEVPAQIVATKASKFFRFSYFFKYSNSRIWLFIVSGHVRPIVASGVSLKRTIKM